MSLADKTLHLCNCNRTMPLDAAALATALQRREPVLIRQQMCQGELDAFAAGAQGDLVVACMQEAKLLGEVAGENKAATAIRFVDIRESGGWSDEAAFATPKIAALLAAAGLPEPAPVPRVTYRSGGQLLIAGPAEAALYWARLLDGQLAVSVLVTDAVRSGTSGVELTGARAFPVYSGTLASIGGWLGEFDVAWTQDNPIDLDACTRCNACVRACPEGAIGESFQVDLERCRAHRACVAACGDVGAIDFSRSERARNAQFDLVLDLQRVPHFRGEGYQPPQGYFGPGPDVAAQMAAATALVAMVGEFEKPKYFQYRANICAHGRAQKTGCSQCIDVCSTRAIAADGDHIRVEPQLCMGCGACTTVCPSGALTYQYPQVPDLGARIKTILRTYAAAGGRDACLLFHAAGGRAVIEQLARRGRGLPASVIPVEVHHVAAVGLDVWFTALAWGAARIAVLATGEEAPQYREATARQMGYARSIIDALGYQGEHLRLIEAADAPGLDRALRDWPPPLAVRAPATFNPVADKRTTIRMAVEHLLAHAPTPRNEIPLPAGAPFGTLAVDAAKCTLCMACVGACPPGALADNPETPQLRFIEEKCVQCGLCAATCPEQAIALTPRLLHGAASKQMRVLNEAPVFACIGCGKPMGTQKMVEGMIARLAGHPMFGTPQALNRLRMCADCRVVDMMRSDGGPDASRGDRLQ